MEAMKNVIKKIIEPSGFTLANKEGLSTLRSELEAAQHTIKQTRYNLNSRSHLSLVLADLEQDQPIGLANLMPESTSQLGQDLFVISRLNCLPDTNFFVEFGATDGVTLSNTHLLEKHFHWNGILAEPAKVWHQRLLNNRNCAIDTRCVAKVTDSQVNFLEVQTIDGDSSSYPELSGIADYADNGDWASKIRKENAETYTVETVSLNDLLRFHNAPKEIGYLSIDTEGSELAILEEFDFNNHTIHIITVEHNFKDDIRSGIYNLLKHHGYTRVLEDVSQWDDWYVLA